MKQFEGGRPPHRFHGNLRSGLQHELPKPFRPNHRFEVRADTVPTTHSNSDLFHSSVAAFRTRTSMGSSHVSRRARAIGTRLDLRRFVRLYRAVRALGRDQKLGGVPLPTPTCKVGTLLQALQNSNDVSCSSSVDAYHRFPPPSHAWLKATMKASTQWPCAEQNWQ